ncbi:MAG: hypothetical protein H6636_11380 [Anaerolineales bacterium]|nr:hypothetical protein [Anaerolineales bacterium]
MPKTIYTEQDIDALKARGATSVEVNEDVILTDLALERAQKHGLKIHRAAQSAPQATYSPSVNTYAAYPKAPPPSDERYQKVKAAVLARLPGPVDPAALETAIRKVLAQHP